MDKNAAEFKKLQATWYAKLKKSGFKDLEHDEEHLKASASSDLLRAYTPESYRSKEHYYQLVGQFLHEYEFKSKYERIVWECHSQGISIRNTVDVLKKSRIKSYRRKVNETLTALKGEMKKSWNKSET